MLSNRDTNHKTQDLFFFNHKSNLIMNSKIHCQQNYVILPISRYIIYEPQNNSSFKSMTKEKWLVIESRQTKVVDLVS
jgi:hypothetical protein